MYTIGLDSGSTTTKGVLFSNEELIDKYLIPTAGNPKGAMTDVVDEQRNQLLWELIWTVVVRAVGHDGRHTVCIVESTDEVV